jgi:hypothetical protein
MKLMMRSKIFFVRTSHIKYEAHTSFVLCRNVLEAKPLEARVPAFGPSTKYVVGSGVGFPAFLGDAFSRSEVDRDLWVIMVDLVYAKMKSHLVSYSQGRALESSVVK